MTVLNLNPFFCEETLNSKIIRYCKKDLNRPKYFTRVEEIINALS